MCQGDHLNALLGNAEDAFGIHVDESNLRSMPEPPFLFLQIPLPLNRKTIDGKPRRRRVARSHGIATDRPPL